MARSFLNILGARQAEPVQPARSALAAHMREVAAVQVRRHVVAAQSASAKRDIAEADRANADIASFQAAIDQTAADARYAGVPAPDESAQKSALASALAKAEKLNSTARSARIANGKYSADLEQTTTELRKLHEPIARLQHAALLEELGELAAEFGEAERRLRDIHRKVFTYALAADGIARAHGLGTFTSSGRFGDLSIPRPTHEAFGNVYGDDYAKGRQIQRDIDDRRGDVAQLEIDAQNLAGKILQR